MSRSLLVNAALLAALLGCAHNPVSFNPKYDFSKVKRIAVLGFEPHERGDSSGKAFAGVFEQEFIEAGFQLVERDEIDHILDEKKFALSGVVDPDQARKLGKLLDVDALVLGSVTLYTPHQTGVVMVDLTTERRDPVVGQKQVEFTENGKKVVRTADVILDYKVTEEHHQEPQIYRVQAEAGAVVKMVDAETGEIAWVGTDTEEGVNIQVASQLVAERIVGSLKKIRPMNKDMKNAVNHG